MEEHQNVTLSSGPSELNRSYYTGNSFSALQSSQQFHDDSTSVHPLDVTCEAMPTSLAEALTQLSFLEFLQRCNLLIAFLQ